MVVGVVEQERCSMCVWISCVHRKVVYWRQRFSMVLQRYTAACVRERSQKAVVREPAMCGDESGRVDYRVLSYVR